MEVDAKELYEKFYSSWTWCQSNFNSCFHRHRFRGAFRRNRSLLHQKRNTPNGWQANRKRPVSSFNYPQKTTWEPTRIIGAPRNPNISTVELRQQRLAHVSYQTLFNMATNNLVEGLTLPVNHHSPNSLGLGCVSRKSTSFSFSHRKNRANKDGQLIHSDICGPLNTETPGGARTAYRNVPTGQ